MDRWLLSEVHLVAAEVTSALEAVRGDAALRCLDGFVANLSSWYLRLCRHRFSPGSNGTDRGSAIATLRECLTVLTRLLAPVVPFLSDYAWDLIRAPGAADSVHLAGWPEPAADLIDERLAEQLRIVRRIVRAGRAARALAGVGGRQPLAEARIAPDLFAALPDDLLTVLAHELNVKSVAPAARAACSPPKRPGRAGAAAPLVALDLRISEPLRQEGIARTATRAIQQARKRAGLSPGDPIAVTWSTPDEEVARALSAFGRYVSEVVGAAEYRRVPGPGPGPRPSPGPGPGPGPGLGLGPGPVPRPSPGIATNDAREHRCDRLALRFWLTPHPSGGTGDAGNAP